MPGPAFSDEGRTFLLARRMPRAGMFPKNARTEGAASAKGIIHGHERCLARASRL